MPPNSPAPDEDRRARIVWLALTHQDKLEEPLMETDDSLKPYDTFSDIPSCPVCQEAYCWTCGTHWRNCAHPV